MGRDHPFSAFAKLSLKLTFLPTHTHTYEMLLKTHKTLFPVGIYMFKVNNRNIRTRCEICSKFIASFWCLYC